MLCSGTTILKELSPISIGECKDNNISEINKVLSSANVNETLTFKRFGMQR